MTNSHGGKTPLNKIDTTMIQMLKLGDKDFKRAVLKYF